MATPTQQDIIDAIYSKLVADTGAGGVHTLTGGRIYENIAPQEASWPFVCFFLLGDRPNDSFTGLTDVEPTFQIDFYGYRRLGAKAIRAIADRAYTLMHKQALTITNYTGGQTWCTNRGHVETEEDAYRVIQEWKILASASS